MSSTYSDRLLYEVGETKTIEKCLSIDMVKRNTVYLPLCKSSV